MRDYNKDQWEALLMVQRYLEGLPASAIERLQEAVEPLAWTPAEGKAVHLAI